MTGCEKRKTKEQIFLHALPVTVDTRTQFKCVLEVQIVLISNYLSPSLSLTGILAATGNGYVIYMTIKRKTKLKPPELMTVNLAIFDFGISGTGLCVRLL